MSRFIKLTNKIINTSQIVRIEIYKKPNAYSLFLNQIYIDGYNFFSFGGISSNELSLHIYEDTHKDDYKIITDWINKIKNDE
jgi:hypothetical protein